MKYYNLNGKLPHITYEFTIPRTSHDMITAAGGITSGPSHSHLNLTYNEVNEDVSGDQLRATNNSRAGVTPVRHYNTQLESDDQSDVQLEEDEEEEEEEEEEELVWEIRTPSPPPPAAMLVYRPADVTSHVFSHNDVKEQGPPVPSGYRSSSNSIDEPSTADDNTLLLSFPGITTSYALCVRYDGTEVDDSYCDSLTRPEPTHEFCTGKECPPRWETSGWSECSRTCGEGVQYRTVRCWKMLSPGLDSSVYDSLCLSHDLHKPANRKVCVGQSCGPQWEVSEWSECSARCGSRGVRTREVRCSMEIRLCNKSSQPIEEQECGIVMSEEQCDQSLRPLAIYPCGDRDCAPHWVEQEWQQCNATCGRGVRQRQVVCAGLEGGVFKEFPDSNCDQTNKPETSSSCFQRPCSKWFTTSWSQCSKTCGSGVQVREVKCYQGEELVTRGHSCDSSLKPEARQSCEIQSCPTEAPAAAPAASVALDDSCQDKPTANCALVLKMPPKATTLLLALMCVCCVEDCVCFPNGSVAFSCGNMMPVHPPFSPSTSSPPFTLSPSSATYRPGGVISVTVEVVKNSSTEFQGFLLQARSRKEHAVMWPVGKFINLDTTLFTVLHCNNMENSAVSQASGAKRKKIQLTWEAPSNSNHGDIYFSATLVQNYRTFWVQLNSSTLELNSGRHSADGVSTD
ncbi:ADAMTS-like protein 2 [Collichthys lucidus]|uniref:ADAMTS-like protein 2 n=1 Tax=Collichthys lucidus TaxID=240159 RepID=A0A4U5UYI6_COLLU|nr:ADAMTS-like protein 2 [Collichthys lucidus]